MQKYSFRGLCHKLYNPNFEHGNLLESRNLIPNLRFTIFSCKDCKGIFFPKERKPPRKIPAKIGRKESEPTKLSHDVGNSCSLLFSRTNPGRGDGTDKSPKNIFPKEKAAFPILSSVTVSFPKKRGSNRKNRKCPKQKEYTKREAGWESLEKREESPPYSPSCTRLHRKCGYSFLKRGRTGERRKSKPHP